MSVRDDKVQIRVEIDGQAGINELGKLEMEAQQLRAAMKGLKKDSEEYATASSQLGDAKQRMAELREEVGLSGLSMRQLRQYQQDLKREWDGAIPSTEKFQGLDNDLKLVNERIQDLAGSLKKPAANFAELSEKVGLAGMSMTQLTQYQKELKTQLDGTVQGTEAYDRLGQKLTEVTTHVNQQNGVLGKWGQAWAQAKTELFSFGLQAAAAFAATAIVGGIQSMIKSAYDLSDALSDIEKTTGMSAAEVQELNSSLREIDTRTATKELREIAIVAGQLGIAKQQIGEFVAATDKLVVSLGDEFQGGAEEVTKVMGGLRQVFTDLKTDDVATDMLHIGNAINSLASDGAATGPVVADFANRIAGVGITMGLTSGQVLGMSATMQELSITTERGGTAVVKILQHMAKAPEEFAKVARNIDGTAMSTQAFTDLVNNDLFAAFTRVTQGAAGSSAGAVQLAQLLDQLGVDGAGASEVMAKLGTNTKMLEEKVKQAGTALTGTDSILGEFDKKTNNLAGKLDKLGKAMAGAFNITGWMKPALESLTDWALKLTGVTSEADKLTEAWQQAKTAAADATATTEPLIKRYEELKTQTTLNVTEQKELDTIMAQLAKTIPSAITGFDKYGKVLGLNTKEMKAWLEQKKAMIAITNGPAIAARQKEVDAEQANVDRLILLQDMYLKRMLALKSGIERVKPGEETLSTVEKRLGKFGEDLEKAKKALEIQQALLANTKGEKSEAEKAKDAAAAIARAAAEKAAAEAAANAAKETLGYLEQIDKRIQELKAKQLKVSKENAPEIAAIQQQIKEQEELRQKLLGEFKAKAKKKAKDETQKDHDELLKDLQKLMADVRAAQEKVNVAQLSDDERELQQVDQKYDELLAKAQAYYKEEKLSFEERGLALLAISQLNEAREAERAEVTEKQRQARAKQRFEQLVAEKTAEANIRVLLASAAVEEKPNDTTKDDNGQTLRDRLMQAQKVQIETIRDLKLKELENYRIAEKLTAEDIEQRRQEIIAESETKIAGIRRVTREEQKQRDLAAATEFLGYVSQMAGVAANFLSQQDQLAERRADADRKSRMKKLDAELKTGVITKQDYERKKSDIETTFERSAATRKKEAAQHEKQAAIVEATIQGIVAVVRALADGGPFAGPALAVLMGGLAAAQIAMLIAQPIPEFREGGYTTAEALALPRENLAQNPGGTLNRGPFLATVNEAGPEYFVPNRLLNEPMVMRHVEAIEAIRTGRSGGEQARGFEAGGYSSPVAADSSPAPTGATMSEATGQAMLHELRQLNAKWSEGQVIQAEVVYEQLATSEKLLTTIRQDASF